MAKDDNQFAELLGTPAAFAQSIRRGYNSAFHPSIVCLVTAIFFALWHHSDYWPTAIGFIAMALIYFPVSLSLYRRKKQRCEKAIRNYEIWYAERIPSGESEP